MNFLPFLSTMALGAALVGQTHVFTVKPAGESCGPQLEVHALSQNEGYAEDLTLAATGLHADALGAMNWGLNPLSVPLPGGCMLLCDAVWGGYFVTSPFGDFKWTCEWPVHDLGYFYMQMGSLEIYPEGGFDVRTTNCKLVSCQIR